MQILIALGLGLKRNWHIFFGLIAGVVVGIFLHGHENVLLSNVLVFIGQVFIRLIQMVVIPLVISAWEIRS
jgi:Na+/H+-dicarboxylate symporter